jgi:uncharacterized membrane protein
MGLYYTALEVLRTSLLLVGSVLIFAGLAHAAFEALRHGPSPMVPQQIVAHAALGLEFFIGAGILNLILNPSWASVTAAILTIVTRKLLTLSLNRLAQGS